MNLVSDSVTDESIYTGLYSKIDSVNKPIEQIGLNEPMEFPNLEVGNVFMMHKYVTIFNYEISNTPKQPNSVMTVVNKNTDSYVDLLDNGKIVWSRGKYKEYLTKKEAYDLYINKPTESRLTGETVTINKEVKTEQKGLLDYLRTKQDSHVKARDKMIKKSKIKTYFFRNPTNNLIKIGKSKNPEKRANQIKGMAGSKLEIIAVIAKDVEHELHTKFKKYQAHSEWFNDKDGLILEYALNA